MGRRKNEAMIESEYIDWLLELSTAPVTLEIRDAVRIQELEAALTELESMIADIDDSCKQRRFRAAIRDALEAQEKLGFCVGHLSHERGV